MNICVLYPGTTSTAHACGDGIVSTLRRMNHKVLACPRGRSDTPRITLEVVNSCDLLLISSPEMLTSIPALSFFEELFDLKDFKVDSSLTPIERIWRMWEKSVKVPVAAYYTESFFRPDKNFDFTALRPLANEHFFPAVQDAEMFDEPHFGASGHCHWLPFGVDTHIFKPPICANCAGRGFKLLTNETCQFCLGSGQAEAQKTLDIGFVGMLYGPRQQFLESLNPHLKDVAIHIGGVHVRDLPDSVYPDGIPWEEEASRLAMNYRKCKVFFNLPSLSQLLVTKVLEVMACGTFLATPVLQGAGVKNCETFLHNVHLCYYKEHNHRLTNQALREFVKRDKEREQIAAAGCHEVRTKHSLKQKLQTILDTVFKQKPFEMPEFAAPDVNAQITNVSAPE